MGAHSSGTDTPGRASCMDMQVVPSAEPPSQEGPTLANVLLWPSQNSWEFHLWAAFCGEVRCDLGVCRSRVNVPGTAAGTHLPSLGLLPSTCVCWGSVAHWRVLKGLLFLGAWAQIGGEAVGTATTLVILAKASGEHGRVVCRLPASF